MDLGAATVDLLSGVLLNPKRPIVILYLREEHVRRLDDLLQVSSLNWRCLILRNNTLGRQHLDILRWLRLRADLLALDSEQLVSHRRRGPLSICIGHDHWHLRPIHEAIAKYLRLAYRHHLWRAQALNREAR